MAIAPVPEAVEPGLAAAAAVVRALAPWSQASRIATFTEHVVESSSLFDPDSWARLARLRDVVDPGRLLVANHRL